MEVRIYEGFGHQIALGVYLCLGLKRDAFFDGRDPSRCNPNVNQGSGAVTQLSAPDQNTQSVCHV